VGTAVGSSSITSVGSSTEALLAFFPAKNALMFFQKSLIPTPAPSNALTKSESTYSLSLGRDIALLLPES